jgi:hypothetical protein
MQIRFNNGIVVEFPKGTDISTIDAVERAITLPKPERDRVLKRAKAKLTIDNFVEATDYNAFRKEVRRGIENVTKMEGPPGPSGEQGEQGEQGEKGEKGEDGTHGKDGLNGLDGQNGLDGTDGKDGKDGIDGKDGKDGEDADTDGLLEEINEKGLLNFSAISGFGQWQENIERTRVAKKTRTFFVNGVKMGDKTNTNFKAGLGVVLDHDVSGDANNLTISSKDGAIDGAYTSKSDTYTATVNDYIVDCTGTFTVTLPTAVGIQGQHFIIKNSGTGTISVTGSETIDDEVTQTLRPYDSMAVVSTGIKFVII